MIALAALRRWAASAAQDLRFGGRTLARTPLATGVMVASIALGIGVATAVFTLVDVMLLRPLPFPMAERLVVPFQTVRVAARARQDTVAWTFARYDVLRRAVRGLDDVGFAAWVDAIVRLPKEDRPIRLEAVTRSLLSTFSLQPQLGRGFTESEDAGTDPTAVAMISDRLWHSGFGASAQTLGSTLEINGAPVRVIGIMPARFNGFAVGADVWMPVRMMIRIEPSARWTDRLAAQTGTVIARMAAGMTTVTLGKYLDAALPLINETVADHIVADNADRGLGVTTLAEARRHPLVRPILELMGAAVTGLIAIVCANIASILLARGHARRGEMGVRIALGASPRRVGRQVLTESALLAIVALPCGVLLGSFAAAALANLRPALPQTWVLLRGTDLLAGASLEPNWRVLVFGSFVAALATILFGIGPAIAAARVDAVKLIATSGDLHATASLRGRQVLVASQLALATLLLISAGLMLRSLDALLNVDLGFQPNGVVSIAVASADTTASARVRRHDLITHLASLPGVTSVATSGCIPYDLACVYSLGIHALGGVGGDRPIDAELHDVSSGYFRTMGLRLVAGRTFVDDDSTTGRTPVVISESAARQLYGTVTAVGKQIMFDQPGAARMDVIGIVHDVRFKSVETGSSPAIYVMSGEDTQAARFSTTLFLRTRLSAGATSATVAREILVGGAPMSVANVRTLAEIVRAETSTTRFVASLLLGFAMTALALAGLGVYGIVAYTVSQRTKELGLRIVLGADDRGLLLATVIRGAALVGVGVGAGLVVALGTTRLVSAFMFGITPLDGVTYAGVVAVMSVIGVAATFIPARQILRIVPSDALRV